MSPFDIWAAAGNTTPPKPGKIGPLMTQTSTTAHVATFTRLAGCALRALRERYEKGRDLFSARERARLRFVRWLYRTGRLMP